MPNQNEPSTNRLDRVLERYRDWPDKGPIVDGVRVTVIPERSWLQQGEPVLLDHIVEVLDDRPVYRMGPKPVSGESVDGLLVSRVPDGDSLVPLDYDGLVTPGPGIDANFVTTSYDLPPGEHEIVWRPRDQVVSNAVHVEIGRRRAE